MTTRIAITTIAGSGILKPAQDDLPAVQVRLFGPTGVCRDGAGNLYIAEYWNHRVRRVDREGVISTVAGDGNAGFAGDGGPAIGASLYRPHGIWCTPEGILYIADHHNNRIRRVGVDGAIETVAGDGAQGFSGDGGPATEARLYHPSAVLATGDGAVYIVDQANHRIRRVGMDGVIETVAGCGEPGYSGDGEKGIHARLQLPRGICVDGAGNIYIADFLNHRVRRVGVDGVIETIAGNGRPGSQGDGGPAAAAQVWFPGSVLCSAGGELYITERGNSHRVRRVGLDGVIETVAGNGIQGFSGDGGPAIEASMSQPNDLCHDVDGGLYIADWGNGRIRRVDTDGTIRTVAGCELAEVPGLEEGLPALRASLEGGALFVDGSGDLYLCESGRHRVRRIGADGIIRTVAGNGRIGFSGDGGPAIEACLHRPAYCFVDGMGSLYIADFMNHRIRRVDTDGIIRTVVGNGEPGYSGDGGPAIEASLNHPGCVLPDGKGRLYIVDVHSHRVRRIDADGIITTVAGSGDPTPFGLQEVCPFTGEGGPAVQATLHPTSLFVDVRGNLFIGSAFNQRIFKVDAEGVITAVAGTGEAGYSGDGGPATEAMIDHPGALLVDGEGNLFFTDVLNQRIRRVDAEGVITTVAGTGEAGYSGDGDADAGIRFRYPGGMAVDRRGNLYISDGGNGRIRRLEGVAASTEPVGSVAPVRAVGEAHESLRDRLYRVEETQEAILNSIADGVFTVDHEWRITSFNRAAERITGLHANQVLGHFCRQVLDTDRCREDCPLALTLEQKQNLFDYEVTLRHRSEHKRQVGINTAVLYDRRGTPIGGVVTFRAPGLIGADEGEAEPVPQFEGLIGKHPSMLAIYDLIAEVADSDATVLILGESGTGKEMVTNALVRRSSRRNGPFVRVNCSAFPDTLLESELFGHVKGAFTDARRDRAGRFQRADGGTIFLDEVGELTPAAQVKLLRVLEEGEFERLGSSETLRVDVRVIAATNQDLPLRVRDRHFRDDLYYRLNVIPLLLPPLRQRRDDLPLLVDFFLAKYRRLTGKQIARVSDPAMDLLLAYDYPGNVRELENAIEHAFARTAGNIITEQKLPLAFQLVSGSPAELPSGEEDERQQIVQALQQARWNRNRAARLLGISRVTLWRRMKSLDIAES